jgi:hypothetical protein
VIFGTAFDLVVDKNNTVLFYTNNELQKKVGSSWVTFPNGGWDTDPNLHGIKLIIDNQNNYYITCFDNGIYFSSDSGSSWTNITAGLPSYLSPFGTIQLSLINLAFDSQNNPYGMSNDDEVEAAPFRGIYIRSFNVSNKELTMPSNFTLYPNPSAGKCYLESNLNFHGEINVSVLDLNGRVISTLDKQSVHNSKMELNLSYLNSGTYFIVINSENTNSAFRWTKL